MYFGPLILWILANIAAPDEMLHTAAFIRVYTVCLSTHYRLNTIIITGQSNIP